VQSNIWFFFPSVAVFQKFTVFLSITTLAILGSVPKFSDFYYWLNVYNLKVYCDNLQKSIHIAMPEIVLFILIENFHQLHDMFYYIVEGTFLPCFKHAISLLIFQLPWYTNDEYIDHASLHWRSLLLKFKLIRDLTSKFQSILVFWIWSTLYFVSNLWKYCLYNNHDAQNSKIWDCHNKHNLGCNKYRFSEEHFERCEGTCHCVSCINIFHLRIHWIDIILRVHRILI